MTQARGVFPLPLTSPQISGKVAVVTLESGGVYVMPSGNYLVACGPNTALQWFDPNATMWRPLSAAQEYTDFNADGTNYRLLNMTGAVASVTVTAGNSGTNGIGPVQTGTTVGFTPSPTGATAQGYAIIGGSVPAPTVVQGGTNFVVPPIVCCDPPPVGGIQATFTATISAAGAITAVTQVTAGAGYTSVPQFYVIPQPMLWQGGPRWPGDSVIQPWPAPGTINPANVWPGTLFQPNITDNGALLTGNALTGSGTLTGLNIIYGGGGYAAAPTISFAGGTLLAAAATATIGAAAATDTSYLQSKVN